MPLIITLTHQKGGVGKTTLACNLYRYFADRLECAILDIDPQGSISESYNLIGNDEEAFWKDVKIIDNKPFQDGLSFEALKERKEKVILIDTPPYLTDYLYSSLTP